MKKSFILAGVLCANLAFGSVLDKLVDECYAGSWYSCFSAASEDSNLGLDSRAFYAQKAITKFKSECEKGDQDSCARYGNFIIQDIYFSIDENLKKPIEEAKELIKNSCDSGSAVGCLIMGGQSKGKEAILYYQKACDAGEENGCRSAEIVKLDLGKDCENVLKKMNEWCEGGEGFACFQLGYEYERYDTKCVKKDAAKSDKLYERACELKDSSGCFYRGLGAKGIERFVWFDKSDEIDPHIEETEVELDGAYESLISSGMTDEQIKAEACKLGAKRHCK